jgi:hypothetical protein
MAKANLVLCDGTKVAIEGAADEVAILLEKLSGKRKFEPAKKRGKKSIAKKAGTQVKRKQKEGPLVRIEGLKEEGFFETKRTIAEIQTKLEEKGHIYPQTHLSTPLLRLVRKKKLRRLKEKKGWVYVKS